ncbi:MAG: chaperone modulator CbpM [Candidatus Thiodiazotropha sp.]
MSEKHLIPLGEILDESIELTLNDLAQRCSVKTEFIVAMVYEGALEPSGKKPEEWNFGGRDLIRLRRAVRLQQDLDVNLPGVALALELLEELDDLRSRLSTLEKRWR